MKEVRVKIGGRFNNVPVSQEEAVKIAERLAAVCEGEEVIFDPWDGKRLLKYVRQS